ncbi:MAG: hypothetical protein Q9193_002685, partial [Seirophora villosa]
MSTSHDRPSIPRSRALGGVAAGIEALLHFRLKQEWDERRKYSALLEQMQLTASLGIQDLFVRKLQHMIRFDNDRQIIWNHMKVVDQLESDAAQSDASKFRKNIGELAQGLDELLLEGFTSFHSVTTLFEYLAARILVKICSDSFVVPQSWISMHLMQICRVGSHTQVPNPSDKSQYVQCLDDLTRSFCRILSRLDGQMSASPRFYIGQRGYPIGLLQQRNAEFLAVTHLNLGLSGGNSNLQKGILERINS